MAQKNRIIEDIFDTGAHNLIHGIVERAIRDYKDALKTTIRAHQTHRKTIEKEWELKQIDRDFHSDWFRALGVVPNYYIPKVQKEVFKELIESGKIEPNILTYIVEGLVADGTISYYELG